MSYILNTRRANAQVDDQAGKVGESSPPGLFLSLLFQKRGQEHLLKLPTEPTNIIFLP